MGLAQPQGRCRDQGVLGESGSPFLCVPWRSHRDTALFSVTPVLLVPVLRPSLCDLFSHSGLGAEEPLSSTTDDTSSPLSTGYNTRSGSEEVVTDTGDLQAEASLHGSQELLTNARTRMRTASELLLDRWDRTRPCAGFQGNSPEQEAQGKKLGEGGRIWLGPGLRSESVYCHGFG